MTIGLYLSERKGYSNEINNTEAGKKLEYTTLGWEASWPIRVSGSLPAAWTEKQSMSGSAKKIRSGIQPPLRGVVWQSMSGARDTLLEEQFDRLCGESSPYEGIIGKDLGRSFPGVEMFRDPEGDGQRMLGRVLKCFSLYDHKIGYCQGLGFLVGPLLMHMGDKQAFCVLVR
mgnify:CR=1 FL=1